MEKSVMKGLPKGFPDVNKKKYWRGPVNGNPDGCGYDPAGTIFFIRDYMADVRRWVRNSGETPT